MSKVYGWKKWYLGRATLFGRLKNQPVIFLASYFMQMKFEVIDLKF